MSEGERKMSEEGDEEEAVKLPIEEVKTLLRKCREHNYTEHFEASGGFIPHTHHKAKVYGECSVCGKKLVKIFDYEETRDKDTDEIIDRRHWIAVPNYCVRLLDVGEGDEVDWKVGDRVVELRKA